MGTTFVQYKGFVLKSTSWSSLFLTTKFFPVSYLLSWKLKITLHSFQKNTFSPPPYQPLERLALQNHQQLKWSVWPSYRTAISIYINVLEQNTGIPSWTLKMNWWTKCFQQGHYNVCVYMEIYSWHLLAMREIYNGSIGHIVLSLVFHQHALPAFHCY